ncbi:hypothetical protein CYMTET_22889 [Cymbomonas tetramitiformis]|uniref:Uncharacterized protein n=1 Tax=Cymbomonas tetramitiformis TaxID=36881 RepID=A0AAE0L1N7_9CHLO|nr:hypothetical protein CYMTET_22889 [Cymbomonas tetramitiformis]
MDSEEDIAALLQRVANQDDQADENYHWCSHLESPELAPTSKARSDVEPTALSRAAGVLQEAKQLLRDLDGESTCSSVELTEDTSASRWQMLRSRVDASTVLPGSSATAAPSMTGHARPASRSPSEAALEQLDTRASRVLKQASKLCARKVELFPARGARSSSRQGMAMGTRRSARRSASPPQFCVTSAASMAAAAAGAPRGDVHPAPGTEREAEEGTGRAPGGGIGPEAGVALAAADVFTSSRPARDLSSQCEAAWRLADQARQRDVRQAQSIISRWVAPDSHRGKDRAGASKLLLDGSDLPETDCSRRAAMEAWTAGKVRTDRMNTADEGNGKGPSIGRHEACSPPTRSLAKAKEASIRCPQRSQGLSSTSPEIRRGAACMSGGSAAAAKQADEAELRSRKEEEEEEEEERQRRRAELQEQHRVLVETEQRLLSERRRFEVYTQKAAAMAWGRYVHASFAAWRSQWLHWQIRLEQAVVHLGWRRRTRLWRAWRRQVEDRCVARALAQEAARAQYAERQGNLARLFCALKALQRALVLWKANVQLQVAARSMQQERHERRQKMELLKVRAAEACRRRLQGGESNGNGPVEPQGAAEPASGPARAHQPALRTQPHQKQSHAPSETSEKKVKGCHGARPQAGSDRTPGSASSGHSGAAGKPEAGAPGGRQHARDALEPDVRITGRHAPQGSAHARRPAASYTLSASPDDASSREAARGGSAQDGEDLPGGELAPTTAKRSPPGDATEAPARLSPPSSLKPGPGPREPPGESRSDQDVAVRREASRQTGTTSWLDAPRSTVGGKKQVALLGYARAGAEGGQGDRTATLGAGLGTEDCAPGLRSALDAGGGSAEPPRAVAEQRSRAQASREEAEGGRCGSEAGVNCDRDGSDGAQGGGEAARKSVLTLSMELAALRQLVRSDLELPEEDDGVEGLPMHDQRDAREPDLGSAAGSEALLDVFTGLSPIHEGAEVAACGARSGVQHGSGGPASVEWPTVPPPPPMAQGDGASDVGESGSRGQARNQEGRDAPGGPAPASSAMQERAEQRKAQRAALKLKYEEKEQMRRAELAAMEARAQLERQKEKEAAVERRRQAALAATAAEQAAHLAQQLMAEQAALARLHAQRALLARAGWRPWRRATRARQRSVVLASRLWALRWGGASLAGWRLATESEAQARGCAAARIYTCIRQGRLRGGMDAFAKWCSLSAMWRRALLSAVLTRWGAEVVDGRGRRQRAAYAPQTGARSLLKWSMQRWAVSVEELQQARLEMLHAAEVEQRSRQAQAREEEAARKRLERQQKAQGWLLEFRGQKAGRELESCWAPPARGATTGGTPKETNGTYAALDFKLKIDGLGLKDA